MAISHATTAQTPESIYVAAAAFRADNPRARARNVAEGIGVSEAELLASRIGRPNESVIRLRPEVPDILMECVAVGPVGALARNHACVHENPGVLRKGEVMRDASMGLFNDEEIDIRFFFRSWVFVFS